MTPGLFLNKCYFEAKLFVHNLIYKEDGEVNIVAIVVLIGIAIALAMVFREQIEGLIQNLFKSITSNSENAIKPKTSSGG